MLLTFEGLDGSGKTTQIKKLIDRLKKNKIDHLLLREPGGTEIGEKIRDILLDKNNSEMSGAAELLLYSASRNQLCKQKIRPALENQQVVICDRFYDSTTAYQGHARDIDINFIQSLNLFAADRLVPDLTILLDITLEERLNRLDEKKLDRLEQEEENFHKKVREGFLALAKTNQDRFSVIDGSQPADQISELIWQAFQKKFIKE